MRLQSDEELVARCAEGAVDALATLYDRHGAAVYRAALLAARGARTQAEENACSAFLALWRDAAAGRARWAGGVRPRLLALACSRSGDGAGPAELGTKVRHGRLVDVGQRASASER